MSNSGNALVILVICVQRKLHSVTNYFLANLAVCDLCVSLFCVYQNLSLYLTSEWLFGETLCKMYHFMQSLAYTASIISMLLISVERYIAIVHPMKAKHLLQMRHFRRTLLLTWVGAALLCAPRLFMFGLVRVHGSTICILQLRLYDPRLYNLVNSIVLFLLPAIVMSVLYSRLCSRLYSKHLQLDYTPSRMHRKFQPIQNQARPLPRSSSQPPYVPSPVGGSSGGRHSDTLVHHHIASKHSVCVELRQDGSRMSSGNNCRSAMTAKRLLRSCCGCGMSDKRNCCCPTGANGYAAEPMNSTALGETSSSSSCIRLSGELISAAGGEGRAPGGVGHLVNVRTVDGGPWTIVNTKAGPETNGFSLNSVGNTPFNIHDQPCNSLRLHVMHNGTEKRSRKGREPRMLSVLSARRKVIRLLIFVVLSFLICHSPIHLRKLFQDWYPDYDGTSDGAILLTISTNLIMYMSSSLNPIIYTLISDKFRKSMVAMFRNLGCLLFHS